MNSGTDRWIVRPTPRPDAALRLVCFHHAGGGASSYRSWASRLPPAVELVAVQFPGRENRREEPALSELEAVLDGVTGALVCPLRGARPPYAFFGHSLGAGIAFQVARRLCDRSLGPAPIHLFLSAAPAPRSRPPEGAQRPVLLDEEGLIERLRKLGGTPEPVLADRALMRAFLPTLKADFALADALAGADAGPLDTPLTLLRGAGDASVSEARLKAWAGLSRRQCRLHTLPGGHFYLQDASEAVLEIIGGVLDLHLADVGADGGACASPAACDPAGVRSAS